MSDTLDDGDAGELELIAPLWSCAKNDVRAALGRELARAR
jgi:hypothetical protein